MAPPPLQCSYCSRHRLSGRRSYLHPQFTAQLVGACFYWHLGTEHVFLWPCASYYYFLRLKFLTTKFLTGDAVCTKHSNVTKILGKSDISKETKGKKGRNACDCRGACMYGHAYSKSMDQPGNVASLARGQLNRKNENFLSAFVRA